jgi:hypothetical protein
VRERISHRFRAAAFGCLCAVNTGCSFLFVQSPPSDVSEAEATRTAPECTSSSTLPVLDVTGAAASGLNVMIVGSSEGYTEDQKKVLMPLHAVYGVLYAISAIYGFDKTGKCRVLKQRFERQGSEWRPELETERPQWNPALKTDGPKPASTAGTSDNARSAAPAPAPLPSTSAVSPPPSGTAPPATPTKSFPVD